MSNVYKEAAKAVGFYDSPLLRAGEPKPIYYDLFKWSEGLFTDCQSGSLNEKLFDTYDKKIAYIQGIFEDRFDGFLDGKGENWVHFANSYHKVERCKLWAYEINCEFLSQSFFSNFIIKHTTEYLCPVCHKLEFPTEFVEFIRNYKTND